MGCELMGVLSRALTGPGADSQRRLLPRQTECSVMEEEKNAFFPPKKASSLLDSLDLNRPRLVGNFPRASHESSSPVFPAN